MTKIEAALLARETEARRKVEAASGELREVTELIEATRIETPISVKVAEYRFKISNRHLCRLAATDLGFMLGGRWYLFPSRLVGYVERRKTPLKKMSV